jgi:hypothetical protein
LKAAAEIVANVLELLSMFSLHDVPQVIIREADFLTCSKIATAILLLVANVFELTTLNGGDHLQALQSHIVCMCFLLVLIVLGIFIFRRCEAKARDNQRCRRRNVPVKRRPKSSRPRIDSVGDQGERFTKLNIGPDLCEPFLANATIDDKGRVVRRSPRLGGATMGSLFVPSSDGRTLLRRSARTRQK